MQKQRRDRVPAIFSEIVWAISHSFPPISLTFCTRYNWLYSGFWARFDELESPRQAAIDSRIFRAVPGGAISLFQNVGSQVHAASPEHHDPGSVSVSHR